MKRRLKDAVHEYIDGRIAATAELLQEMTDEATSSMLSYAEDWVPAWRLRKSHLQAQAAIFRDSEGIEAEIVLSHKPFFGDEVKDASWFGNLAVIGPARQRFIEELTMRLDDVWEENA